MRIQSTVTFTREQLYQRVWSKPLSLVAEELGVSGNALAKICSRLLVPYPPRGYWAKVSGGKALVRPSLPAAPEVNMRRVTISSERAASRRTRTRLKPSERREQLIDVAKEIILKEGMHAATMKRIAAHAGVSETQAYNYFGSQEKLFVALAIAETAKIRAAQIAEVSQIKAPLCASDSLDADVSAADRSSQRLVANVAEKSAGSCGLKGRESQARQYRPQCACATLGGIVWHTLENSSRLHGDLVAIVRTCRKTHLRQKNSARAGGAHVSCYCAARITQRDRGLS